MKKLIISVLTSLCVGVTIGVMATDSLTAGAVQLVYERESLQNPPACVLTLEEAKVKNMTEWDYCRVDGEYDAWYFRGDGSAKGDNNPEIRFVADGVQTATAPYTLPPIEVGSFSFEYCIVNNAPAGVVDLLRENYIVQILGADTLYPVIPVEVEADGDWHTITVDGSTAFYGMTGGEATTYGEYQDKFCGFLFKMGGLDGEFMIRNITLYDFDGKEISSEIETPDVGNSVQEENSSEIESSFDIPELPELVTSQSNTVENGTNTNDSKGCGSFGVGAMTLGALTAAGVVLGISKKKRR